MFCGVHFMAESADILSAEYQKVLLPDMSAGCSMADMAAVDQVETRLLGGPGPDYPRKSRPSHLHELDRGHQGILRPPRNGAVCTSSNSAAVMRWALERGDLKVLFLPDQHLGRNTAHALGYRLGRDGRLGSVRRARREHGRSPAMKRASSCGKSHCSVPSSRFTCLSI